MTGGCSGTPTPEELAVELDMTPEKVVEVQKYGREPISLHTPLGEDGDSEFGDLIEDSEAIQPGEAVSFTLLQEQLHSVLDTLSEREAGVVSMRFGLTDGRQLQDVTSDPRPPGSRAHRTPRTGRPASYSASSRYPPRIGRVSFGNWRKEAVAERDVHPPGGRARRVRHRGGLLRPRLGGRAVGLPRLYRG